VKASARLDRAVGNEVRHQIHRRVANIHELHRVTTYSFGADIGDSEMISRRLRLLGLDNPGPLGTAGAAAPQVVPETCRSRGDGAAQDHD
jgi:hypothetical protein